MNKCFVIFSALYLPSAYGVERYTYNLAKKLTDKGNKVIIVTCNVFDLSFYEKSEENIEIYRVPCIKLLNGRFPVITYSKLYRKAIKEIKNQNVNLIIVNTRFYLSSLFGVITAKKLRVKSILIEHGTSHFSVNSKFWDGLGHIYEHFITTVIKKYCKDFYGVSKACNDWLNHFNIKARGLLYNSIDIKYIESVNLSKEIYLNKYNIKINDKLVIFVGRLVKEKGILNLVEAFNTLNKKKSNIKLFIAGDGPLLSTIREIKNDNIFVLGKIEFEEVIRLLKLCDIYCLPTEYSEGFPTSLLEAAACKDFLITTDKGGSKELIKDNSFGIILKDTKIDTIKQAIEIAIDNESYMNSAINNTFNRVINNYEWENTVKKIVDMI